MPWQPDGTFAIQTKSEWRLVASETWTDVFETLGGCGELTAREIAERCGRTRQNVYFHLNKLQEVGLVRVVGQRVAVKRPEAVYALSTERIRLQVDPLDPESLNRFVHAYSSLMRAMAREFGASARGGRLDMEGRARAWVAFKDVARLDAPQIARVGALLAEVDAIMSDARGASEGTLWTVLAVSIPR